MAAKITLLLCLISQHCFVFSRFAYIEFADKESVRTAMALDESLFRGRQIKVRCSFIIILFLLNHMVSISSGPAAP